MRKAFLQTLLTTGIEVLPSLFRLIYGISLGKQISNRLRGLDQALV